jgi:predicted transcriptional regulator
MFAKGDAGLSTNLWIGNATSKSSFERQVLIDHPIRLYQTKGKAWVLRRRQRKRGKGRPGGLGKFVAVVES